jgi:hypothetical protein
MSEEHFRLKPRLLKALFFEVIRRPNQQAVDRPGFGGHGCSLEVRLVVFTLRVKTSSRGA